MYAFISGRVVAKSPAAVVLDNQGIGYEIHISLNTYTRIQHLEECRLYTYLVVREDAHILFGFADEAEKELFVHLISVSGVGPNTARMVLSAMLPQEFIQAIIMEDETALGRIKGIGPKSAKRLIVELKDKVGKAGHTMLTTPDAGNTARAEALSALVALGFSRPASEKAIQKAAQSLAPGIPAEEIIKLALKNL
jgi:holliday junction DNA helicase RuvA